MITSTTMPFGKLRLRDETFSNPRTHSGLGDDDIIELALDIGWKGLLTPLLVTADGLVLAGQRRYTAIEMLLGWWGARSAEERQVRLPRAFQTVTTEELQAFGVTCAQLVSAVPVRVIDADTDRDGIALADNLLRTDLSSYEIAAKLYELAQKGATGRELARLIGKSPTYVSRKLSAWVGAGAELKQQWAKGLDEQTVQELAQLPIQEQAKELAAPVPRGRRGVANRPSIDQVKDALLELERLGLSETRHVLVGKERYAAGATDALRWVCGLETHLDFAALINDGAA